MKFAMIAGIVDHEPFRPFVVTTSTGESYRVPHREHVFLPPSKSEILIYDEDMHFRIIDVGHVVSIEPERERPKKR